MVNIYTNEAVGIDNYGTIVITSQQIHYREHNSGLLTLTNLINGEKATEHDNKMCLTSTSNKESSKVRLVDNRRHTVLMVAAI